VSPIMDQLGFYEDAGLRTFSTSSFQSQSIPLLHILSKFINPPTVVLTSTGYLFPETMSFADQIASKLQLKLIKVQSRIPKSSQRDLHGNLLYAGDPDLCCTINKVDPLEEFLLSSDVWINGVRRDQSSARHGLRPFEKSRHGCIRYHPMLDWSAKEIFYYRRCFELDNHPLEELGYRSIGCQPCTALHSEEGNERNSRWIGMNKVECGLNTDLIVREA